MNTRFLYLEDIKILRYRIHYTEIIRCQYLVDELTNDHHSMINEQT